MEALLLKLVSFQTKGGMAKGDSVVGTAVATGYLQPRVSLHRAQIINDISLGLPVGGSNSLDISESAAEFLLCQAWLESFFVLI